MTRQHPLGEPRGAVGLLRFALPTVLMMVCTGLYTIVDTVFIARFVGTDALAAVNIVCPVVNLTVGLGSMLAAGGNAVVSYSIGAGEEANAKFTQLTLAAAAVGGVLALLGGLSLDQILHLLGASPRLWDDCQSYLGTLLLFLPASMLQTLFASFFVTAGRPGLGSALSIGAGVLNLVLDVYFMAVCGLGVRGAALGTGFGQLVPAVVGLYFFARRKDAPAFRRPEKSLRVLAAVCANGSSELVGQLAAALTTALFNGSMLSLRGEDGVAAMTILIYAQFLFSTACLGFSMGVAPILGWQFGNRAREGLRQTIRSCLCLTAAGSVLVFAAGFWGSGMLVRLFTSPESPVYVLAAHGFRIFSISFLFCGTNLFTSALFTALSDGKTSAFLSFLRTFVFLTAGIVFLPRVLGVEGLWLAVPLAEAASFVCSLVCLNRLRHALP